MIWRCLDSLTVLAAFAAVYIIPPLLALRRFRLSEDRLTLLVISAGLGLSSQALLGFCWNHFVSHAPLVEGVGYFLFWLTAGLVLRWRHKSFSPSRTQLLPLGTPSSMLLALIILAAIILRSLDALDHASLGQSDAYTHLQFLRDIFQYGQIRNIVYPPGYSWVLALPVMTFHLDAYLVARYVGPFFGAMLVTTLYLLGRRQSQTAGLYAAFLAAICPIFYPLIKTGMGAFANQLGLFLLPLALLLYLMEARFLFAIILLGLTVTVPLFVFTLMLIILIHRLLTLSSPRRWWRNNLLLLIPFLLAFALAGYHFLSPGKIHVTTTATLVTGISTPSKKLLAPTAPHPSFLTMVKFNPAGKLALDLLTVKRCGLGSNLMNLTALALAWLFAGILVAGFRLGKPRPPIKNQLFCSSGGRGSFEPSSGQDLVENPKSFLKMIGCLGLLTTLQVTTGFLEFSFYQRSGWILMEAMALAGGIILAWLYEIHTLRIIIRPGIALGLSASVIVAFWIPPQHRCITSGAENELASVLRELSDARLNAHHCEGPLAFDRPEPSPLILQAAKAANLAIFTRRYTMFNADQGNMADVIPDPTAQILQFPVDKDSHLTPPCHHFLCFVDRSSGLPSMGLLDLISPELTHSLTQYQPMLYKPNEVILAFLSSLPDDEWKISREERGPNLSIYFVEHQQKEKP